MVLLAQGSEINAKINNLSKDEIYCPNMVSATNMKVLVFFPNSIWFGEVNSRELKQHRVSTKNRNG